MAYFYAISIPRTTTTTTTVATESFIIRVITQLGGNGALRQPAFHRIVSPRCGRSDGLRRNMECFIPPPSFILPLLYPEFSINAKIPTR